MRMFHVKHWFLASHKGEDGRPTSESMTIRIGTERAPESPMEQLTAELAAGNRGLRTEAVKAGRDALCGRARPEEVDPSAAVRAVLLQRAEQGRERAYGSDEDRVERLFMGRRACIRARLEPEIFDACGNDDHVLGPQLPHGALQERGLPPSQPGSPSSLARRSRVRDSRKTGAASHVE